MATDVTKTRGENLDVTVTIQDNGTNVSASTANGYSIEAFLSNIKAGEELYDLGATFSNGAGRISYNTANLNAAIYYFDVKLGFPSGETRWTNTVSVTIQEPITDP